MKIAHVTATFPPYLGGTGNVALQNARCLAERGHQVTVYTASSNGVAQTGPDGVEVRRLTTPLRIGNAPLTPGLLRIHGFDLVHLHYPFIFGAEMVLALKHLRRQPYVLTYHNDLISPGLKGSIFSVYERLWTRRLLRSAAKVIVTSWDGAGASSVVGSMIRAQPAHFIEVPNGVDMRIFRPAPKSRALGDKLGIRGQQRVLAFVGSMDGAHHPKGGVPVLLEALARLRDETTVAVLVGSGDKVEAYSAMAERLGIAGRVRFIGKVPNEELPSVLALADVVVQPSLHFEPFGLVAVEAMACGRPVVVSDLPGVRRVVSDAGGGLLAIPGDPVDLAEKLERLLSDPRLWRRLAANGRAGVESRYDLDAVGPRLEATYREVLGVADGR